MIVKSRKYLLNKGQFPLGEFIRAKRKAFNFLLFSKVNKNRFSTFFAGEQVGINPTCSRRKKSQTNKIIEKWSPDRKMQVSKKKQIENEEAHIRINKMAQFRRAVNAEEKQQQLTFALLQSAAKQFNFTFDNTETEEMEGTQDFSNYSPAVTFATREEPPPPPHDNNGIDTQEEDSEENAGDLVVESFSVIAFEKEIFLESVST